ncbi:MAG TPA: hypothetical protein VEL28_05705 [Candidatus Binatia bacterium]|nr:hypothetical protein [Candidatus Binatia bacterium]
MPKDVAVKANAPIYTATVSTRMMPDYRVEVPATDASRIALVWNEAADLDVVSIGSDRALYHLYRDQVSATGWSSHQLNLEKVDDLVVTSAPGRPDRLFAIGAPLGKTSCLNEMIRGIDGSYAPRAFGGPVMFAGSLSVLQCGARMVAVGKASTGTFFDRAVTGALSTDVGFFVRCGEVGVRADKVVCLSRDNNVWPHLSIVSLCDGVLRSDRGMREKPISGEDAARLPEAAGPGSKYIYLDCDQMPLPALPGVVDFTAVATSRDEALLLAVDASSRVHLLTGTFDAASPGLVRWASQWQALALTGESQPSLSRICAVQLPDGKTRVILHEAVSGNLWVTGWGGPGLAEWDHAVNLGIGGHGFAASISHRQEMAFATTDPDKGIHAWTRTSAGGWRRESVHVSTGRRIAQKRARRVSVSFHDEHNADVGTQAVRVRASEDMAVTINGRSCVIGADKPATVLTRAGCVHVTSSIGGTLHVPVLTFEADFIPGSRLEVRADQDVQSYLRAVTGEQLLAAVDPFTGKEILRNRDLKDAQKVASALRDAAGLLEAYHAPARHGSGNLRVAAMRGVRVVAADAPLASGAIRGSRRAPAWALASRGGKLTLRRLPAEEVAILRARAIAVGDANDFLGIDWGSIVESIVNGISTVREVALETAGALLTVVINGVEYVFRLAVQTAEHVYDIVTSILDRAGAELGAVVGWLMKELGFLFDWEKIKRSRDRLRAHYIEALTALPQHVTDPLAWEQPIRNYLEDARTDVTAWIDQIRTRYLGQTPLGRVIGTPPAYPSLFEAGGASVFPQAMWLLDKVMEEIGELAGDASLPLIPGLPEAMGELSTSLLSVEGPFMELGAALGSGHLVSWIADMATFRADTILPLLDFAAARIDSIVDGVEAVVAAVLRVAHLFWANMSAVISWLDREIEVPFLSAFYAGVVESKLSLLDVFSLVVAVPYSIIGSDPGSWPQMDWLDVSMVLWAPVHTVVEALAFGVPEIGPRIRYVTGAMLIILGASILLEAEERWTWLGEPMCLAGLASIVIALMGGGQLAFCVVAALLATISLLILSLTGDPLVGGACALFELTIVMRGLEAFLPAEVRARPHAIVIYSATQGVLALGTTALFFGRHGGEVEVAVG